MAVEKRMVLRQIFDGKLLASLAFFGRDQPVVSRGPGLVGGGATLLLTLFVLCFSAGQSEAAPLFVNEYNGVRDDRYLNGGDDLEDDDGEQASDVFLGRIVGNGGDWFELVVTAEVLDVRGWQILIDDDGGSTLATLTFSQDPLLATLEAGTIVTIAEDLLEDASYDPDAGDWGIQLTAGSAGSGTYISATPFEVSHDDTTFEIRNDSGLLVFGPNGEGVNAPSGVSSREVGALEADPSAGVTATSPDYDDGTSSTFGAANAVGGGETQDFSALRIGLPVGDLDFDGWADCADNCPEAANIDQVDTDQDGFGDACDADQGSPAGPGLPAEGCAVEDPFDPEVLMQVEVFMSQADWNALRLEPRPLNELFPATCPKAPAESPFEFFPADATINGVTITNIGVRKKGFLGSVNSQRPSLKLKFSEFEDDQRLFGLKRLTLNNGNQDPSRIKTCLSYKVFTDAGIPAPRCNFARVQVTHENGTVDLGIYAHVESLKSAFLRRAFGSADGNLYEAAALADLETDSVGFYEIKNNEDTNDTADIWRLADTVTNASSADLLTDLGELLDLDEFLTFWTTEALVGHWDGYAGDRNNNYMYVDPATGLFRFIPWGTDDTFGRGNPFGGNEAVAPLVWWEGRLVWRLYGKPGVAAAYQTRMQSLFDTIWDEAELLAEIDRMEALITPFAGDISDHTAEIRDFVTTREARFLAEFSGGPPSRGNPGDPRPCFGGTDFGSQVECPVCDFEREDEKCQEAIAKAGLGLVKKRMIDMRRCRELLGKGVGLTLADGVTVLTDPEDCGEELRVSQSTTKLAIKSRKKIAAKCTNPIVAKLATCANSVNALITVDGRAGCLLDDHLDRADAMVAYEFGANPPSDRAARKCQSGLARAGLTYATKTMKAVQKCRDSSNAGKDLFLDKEGSRPLVSSAECSREYRAAAEIARGGIKARAKLERSGCDAATLTSLDTCATTLDGMVGADGTTGCFIEGHDAERFQALRKQYCDEKICP